MKVGPPHLTEWGEVWQDFVLDDEARLLLNITDNMDGEVRMETLAFDPNAMRNALHEVEPLLGGRAE